MRYDNRPDESCKVCEGTGIRTISADLSQIYGVPELRSGIQVSEYRTLCYCVVLKLIESMLPKPITIDEMAFEIGTLYITTGAKAKCESRGDNAMREVSILVARHWRKHWGDLDSEDRALNDKALETGDRLFSRYEVAPDFNIYIITEADRSMTTVLLADEC